MIDSDRIFVLDHGTIVEQGTHAELLRRSGAYHSLMANQIGENHRDYLQSNHFGINKMSNKEVFEREYNNLITGYGTNETQQEPDDEILKAEGLSWSETIRYLMQLIAPWKAKLMLTFVLGVTRVFALIGVGIVSALIVASIKNEIPYDSIVDFTFLSLHHLQGYFIGWNLGSLMIRRFVC